MTGKQNYFDIETATVVAKTAELKKTGYRIVQIGATRCSDHLEVNYSFDRDYEFTNLKVKLPLDGAELPSIGANYWNAFLYENEIHDLFGVAFTNLPLDYRGNFYRTAEKSAFNPVVKAEAKTASKTGAEVVKNG